MRASGQRRRCERPAVCRILRIQQGLSIVFRLFFICLTSVHIPIATALRAVLSPNAPPITALEIGSGTAQASLLPRAVSLHRPHLFTHSTRFICSANFAMNPLSTSHGAIFSLLAGFISSAVRLMLARQVAAQRNARRGCGCCQVRDAGHACCACSVHVIRPSSRPKASRARAARRIKRVRRSDCCNSSPSLMFQLQWRLELACALCWSPV
jgi:hypothetical protein